MERIVAMMDDLFFQMKVAETAKHLGLELKVATNGDALLELLEPAPKLVIVDLNARSQPLAGHRARARRTKRFEGYWLSLSRAARFGRAGASGGLRRSDAPIRLHPKSGGDFECRKGLM